MILVDFKLEFGLHGRLILADEISPDTCRFWDRATESWMGIGLKRSG
jgi:phosphoribosylaminoimidazole-succinocarboxamide synthase